MPGFVRKALIENSMMEKFNSRIPYQQNDYIGWINRAVMDKTKQKHTNQMVVEYKKAAYI